MADRRRATTRIPLTNPRKNAEPEPSLAVLPRSRLQLGRVRPAPSLAQKESYMATDMNTGLAETEVLDTTGQPRNVVDLWAEQPVVLALIRHFG